MSKGRVLVVDDQLSMRGLVVHMVSQLGYEVVGQAKDGAEAIIQIAATKPDVLVSDINMPVMNGLALLKAIRTGKTEAAPSLPVLLLTGHADGLAVKTAVALDVAGFLVKPASPANLKARLERALGSAPTVKPVASYAGVPIPEVDTFEATRTAHRTVTGSAGRPVAVAQLKPGLRLAQPVIASDGAEVMPAGVILDADAIARVMDLAELGAIPNAVHIAG